MPNSDPEGLPFLGTVPYRSLTVDFKLCALKPQVNGLRFAISTFAMKKYFGFIFWFLTLSLPVQAGEFDRLEQVLRGFAAKMDNLTQRGDARAEAEAIILKAKSKHPVVAGMDINAAVDEFRNQYQKLQNEVSDAKTILEHRDKISDPLVKDYINRTLRNAAKIGASSLRREVLEELNNYAEFFTDPRAFKEPQYKIAMNELRSIYETSEIYSAEPTRSGPLGGIPWTLNASCREIIEGNNTHRTD